MRYLFVDNFRGFTETVVPIRDVNFFVGENSTGKTSLMSLIKLLASPRFWFQAEFNTEEVKLGNFNDIVSINSSDRSYFRIGFAEVTTEKNENQVTQAFLCTYHEEDGMPNIFDYTTVSSGEQTRFHFGAKTCKYRQEGLLEIHDDSKFIRNMFLNWANSHKEVGKGYKSFGETVDRREALAFIPPILYRIAQTKGTNKPPKSYSYYMPRPFGSIIWLAPIRSRPLRTYDSYGLDFSPDGEHIPYLIKKYLSRRTKEQQRRAGKFIKFIQRFGRESGLFKSVAIREYDRRSKTSPFELDIILTEEALSVDNVGYGVSQCLPVIVEIFVRPRGSWFAIQQPEIHLHPRAQSAMGNLIFELASIENKKFIVETHNDFIIDGYRLNYQSKKYKRKPDAQIVFFERTPAGNVLHEIEILQNGEISDSQPEAYRGFFLKEEMRLLGL